MKHGGNMRAMAAEAGCAAEDILDLSANLNPLGPPTWLRREISMHIADLVHYPDPECTELVDALAERQGIDPRQVLVGNGASELIHAIPRAIQAQRAVVTPPAYVDYTAACKAARLPVHSVLRRREDDFSVSWNDLSAAVRPGDMIWLGHPNNPSGALLEVGPLTRLIAANPDSTFVIDEAFIDFAPEHSVAPNVLRFPNALILRSMTKFYAIPGLRLGAILGAEELISRLRDAVPTWSVNTFAQSVGLRAIRDIDYATLSREVTNKHRGELQQSLHELAIQTVPSSANYILCRSRIPAVELRRRLLKNHRIGIRACSNYEGLDDFDFRVAVQSGENNRRLIDALAAELRPGAPVRKANHPTPALMLQGTCSNAGKSVLTAAFCRILLQDGFCVAPFKAQNMANNSYVTRNGEEIARAQATQAQACRLDPDIRFSPILLKPSSDTGCQVILNGKPVANMNVRGYDKFKVEAFKKVKESYDSLAADYDAIVLEGAGSPGEVNLKAGDIVNMAMAQYARSPVLLAGDIDRGGVFASFVGTMEVLDQWERDLVAGFLVNKFRGDPSLLDDAYAYTLDHTGKPVLGCIPFIHDLGIPDEDSVSFKNGISNSSAQRPDAVEITVIDLPHISNFTDIDPFLLEPDVAVRVVKAAGEIGRPDAIVIPGSKNTIADLRLLCATGVADQLRDAAESGIEIIGICGGFQMLGRTIEDPTGIESAARQVDALGLLDVKTTMATDKKLSQTTARHLEFDETVHGYEIHHGQSESGGLRTIFSNDCGVSNESGLIWGTYLHGVFDADGFRRKFINRLRRRRGFAPLKSGAIFDLAPAFDRLADHVRQSVDMDAIYKTMGV